jgi:RimJ/RimL family protein N-acetyltransferase
MEIPTLQTERLLLRPFRAADFEAYAEMNANPEVMRYIDAVQDREAAFRSLCANIGHWEVRGYGPWAVEERATGRLVGRAGLFFWETRPGLELGYALIPSAWGKGYAFEAAARSLRHAHQTLGARGVLSVIHPDNKASIRVTEKLGARLDREVVLRNQPLHVYVLRDP